MPRQPEGRVLAGGDISASDIVVMIERADGGRERAIFPNTAAGHKSLIAWLLKRGTEARVVIEATGNYSLDVAFALQRHASIEVRVAREWAYRFAYKSSAERKQWLQPFLHFYNCHRAHSSLGDHPPISRLIRKNVLTRNS